MKSLTTKLLGLLLGWMAASCIGGEAGTVQAAPSLPSFSVHAQADSTITVKVDSAVTVELPDTLIRRLARSLGMADTAEIRRKCPGLTAQAPKKKTRYEIRRARAIKGWSKLIPKQATLQFAGSIGLLSAGLGWHYGKSDQWETELLVGFVPRYKSESAKTTFTIKERYVPWRCVLGSRWAIEPLTTGVFFNTISGDDFWKNQPDRYPKSYYGFSTKVRANIFIGQRLRYNIPQSKRRLHQAVSLYYEISSCDLYIVSKATNKEFPWRETLSLAFGLKWEM